jgi:hypothetical protein
MTWTTRVFWYGGAAEQGDQSDQVNAQPRFGLLGSGAWHGRVVDVDASAPVAGREQLLPWPCLCVVMTQWRVWRSVLSSQAPHADQYPWQSMAGQSLDAGEAGQGRPPSLGCWNTTMSRDCR